jgi:ribosomal-protein-alanine N-acetyltransferase
VIPRRASDPLQLRHLAITDADAVFELWSDLQTIMFTSWPLTTTRAQCLEQLEKLLRFHALEPRHFGPFALYSADGSCLGLAGADLYDSALCMYSIWYIVARTHWGQGVGTRALQQLLERMAASGRVRQVSASVVPANTASKKLLQRQGFTVAALRPAAHHNHGLTLDLLVYERDI